MKYFSLIMSIAIVSSLIMAMDCKKVMNGKDQSAAQYNLNKQDSVGCTLLHHYASWGLKNNVRVLLEYKADPNIQDNAGQTSLHTTHDLVIAQLLLDYKADITIRDFSGKTPLDRAKEYCAAWDGFSHTQAPDLIALLEKLLE
jgi:hypothetical protein